jgi:hypothetical protein
MTLYSEKAVGQYSGVKVLRGGAENCQYPGYHLQQDGASLDRFQLLCSCHALLTHQDTQQSSQFRRGGILGNYVIIQCCQRPHSSRVVLSVIKTKGRDPIKHALLGAWYDFVLHERIIFESLRILSLITQSKDRMMIHRSPKHG